MFTTSKKRARHGGYDGRKGICMNCRYTEDELKSDVEKNIGIRAKDIEKIQFCGLWHIRFRAFGTDFYYWRADSDDTNHLKESAWQWS